LSSSPGSTDGPAARASAASSSSGAPPAFRSPALRDLIGKRVLAGLDPVDGILGMGMF
jgi:hypothetical protein